MKLLVLGGTLFLSRAVAVEAVARGHDVTCAARGTSGTVPRGARHVVLDRSSASRPADWVALDGDWDAVVDVSRTPSWVRDALEALADRTRHWTFVSSISVYADSATPGGGPETLPLLPAITEDVVQDSPEKYGASKVGCEQAVQARATRALVLRPGLIVGPGDPTGRFSYWPERMVEGGEVLAPGPPEAPTQVIDVRDLAAWIVTCAEREHTGVLDAVGPQTPLGELLDEVAAGVGADPDLVWADPDSLTAHEVRPWAGPRSLPLWLPRQSQGLMAHDPEPSVAAGLTPRPVAETAADTLAWLRGTDHPERTGLTRAEERHVLDAYLARQ